RLDGHGATLSGDRTYCGRGGRAPPDRSRRPRERPRKPQERQTMVDFTEDELDELRGESQRAYDLDRAHVFHSWSAQKQITPMVVSRATGSYGYDGEGRPLLDFSSQLVNTNIGHQHPKVVQAIKD